MKTKHYKSKETVLVITVGFLLLFILYKSRVFLITALVIGLAGVLSFWASEKIDWFWGRLSYYLGKISNTVLLTVIFFLVLTPMGLVRRWLGKGMIEQFDQGKTSNFSDRDQLFVKKDLENTW